MSSIFDCSDPIMPTRLEAKQNCWKIRSNLEKILIVAFIPTIIIIITLAILLSQKSTDLTCNTSVCLNEAAQVVQYIDPEINPCEDFYQFACGNFLKNAHADESLNFLNRLKEQGKRELLEVYREPIKDDEHFMVKTAKKLFEACLNENLNEEANLRSIKHAIAVAGGWPALDGVHWNETNFDWLQATYTLRQLGYHHSAFLDLTVEAERTLKVKLPDVFDYSSHNFDKLEFMVETAMAFGAIDRDHVTSDMKTAHDFLIALQLETHNHYGVGNSSKYTVGKFQQKYGAIDWVQFLNNLTNPVVTIRKNDTVIFPPAPTLRSWIDLITNTPKRTQANYLMWTVIEKVLPYLSEKYQNYNIVWKKSLSPQEICLDRIHDRFVPNPMDIVCDRRYLPLEKKKKVEELVSDIKSELASVVEQGNAPERDKKIDIINSMKVIIGQPEDYFHNNIFDQIAVDMVKNRDESFIGLMAQANRNKQSQLYAEVAKNESSLYYKWYLRGGEHLPVYINEDNTLFLSTMITENFMYNENRPNCLNYGALGTNVAFPLSVLAIPLLGQEEKVNCMKKSMNTYNVTLDNFQAAMTLQFSLGTHIADRAYRKYMKKHDQEDLKLLGVDYTPRQLFWIAAIPMVCETASMGIPLIAATISGSIRNNPTFSSDFNCGADAKMNPKTKCELV